jgi:hypothetical protein
LVHPIFQRSESFHACPSIALTCWRKKKCGNNTSDNRDGGDVEGGKNQEKPDQELTRREIPVWSRE